MRCGLIPVTTLGVSLAKATRRQCYELDFLEMGQAILEVFDWE